MKESKSKRLFWVAIMVCVWLLVSRVLSLVILNLAAPYGNEALIRAQMISTILMDVLNILVFSICAWNMRENKRLLLPLCLYVITQGIMVAAPNASFLGLFASCMLICFYTAFCRHPQKGLRVSAFAATFGCGISVFIHMIYILFILSYITWDQFAVATDVIDILSLFALVLPVVFWIVFALEMKKTENI